MDRPYAPKPRELMAVADWVDPDAIREPVDGLGDDSTGLPDDDLVDENECLDCYLSRMLERYGCRGHHFTERWIDAQPKPMAGLMKWLESQGGCCCDCEVVFNVFARGRTTRRFAHLSCGRSAAAE